MKWANLKDMRCPKCGKKIYETNNVYACTDRGCHFSIGKEKFDALIKDLYKGSRHQEMSEDDRLGELNNYGRPKRSEDFSDSPHL